ncbi:MAG TPA: DUF4861 family protein [Verrucomicrobiae bacterium]|nr:DUF4861 family protein [Verrucomicrobiae bacterium]
MSKIQTVLTTAFAVALPAWCGAAPNQLTVKAANRLTVARPSQTVELSARDLAPLGELDLDKIHVRDAAGKELLCQAVDTDGDYAPDVVIFQADFAPGESKTFTVTAGRKQVYTKDQFKAFGRFVRERFDDFAWENDRIAHRMYGKALETWQQEPLSSSTVDIWSKRVPRLVVNDWYLLDNYHSDAGEGADFYSAGLSRGDGGSGLWTADKLWVSRNFVQSRVLANGPIRVMFELTYEPFDVDGVSVGEVKRITLDAGQNLDHYQNFYIPFTKPDKSATLTAAIGLKKVVGEKTELNAERGWLVKWEPMEKNAGNQGLAIVFDPKLFEKTTEDKLNLLVLQKVPDDDRLSYWAGFYWDKSGQFADEAAWKTYAEQFSRGLASPIEISVSVD